MDFFFFNNVFAILLPFSPLDGTLLQDRSTRPGNAEHGAGGEVAPGSPWPELGPLPQYKESPHL